MKIAVVKGGNLCKWDSVVFSNITKGHEVTFIGIKNARLDLSGIKEHKILLYSPETFLRWIGYPLILVDYLLNLNMVLFGLESKLKEFDIVETSDTTYPFTYQAVNSHPLVVCNCYENILFFREWGITKTYKSTARKKAKHFIAVTEKAKSVLELEGVSSERITVIPPGIDIDMFKSRPKDKNLLKQYNLNNNDINILFAGRIVYDKGIEDLAYAFKLLCDKHDNVKLLILGKGKWKKKIINILERYNIKDRVRFLGFLPYEQTEKFYNIADIFCTPSRITKYWQEQFGFVFAEAMACGKPIVSTHAGSIPEVLGGTGLLVSPGNHLELFEALDKLVKNPELRKELSRKARNYAVKNYDAKVIAKKRLALYEKIYKQHKKSI